MTHEIYQVGTVSTSMYYGRLENMKGLERYRKALWIVDEHTKQFLPRFAQHTVEIPSGEAHKTLDSVKTILNKAIVLELGRDDTIIGLGGGVICDMAGFAASLYMRGCRAVLMPTTLLAMNDASLGGKTGIDYLGYKNLLGAFYPASEIYLFTDALLTLTERDYLSGLSEVIKHAFLDGKDFLDQLIQNKEALLNRDLSVLDHVIPRSLGVKGGIVEQDAKEHGIRAHLNLGHTFGHALESASKFSLTHGECVAWGIGKAMEAGLSLKITDPEYAGTVSAVLQDFGFTLEYPGFDTAQILDNMKMDKKKRKGSIRFILQRNIGDTVITEVPESVLKEIL